LIDFHNAANQPRDFLASAELALCTTGMSVNLWGGSPLYVNPVNMLNILTKVLAEGNRLRKGFAGQEGDLQIFAIYLSGVA
jgi:hypothetical protein